MLRQGKEVPEMKNKKITADGPFFVTDQGDRFFARGINMVCKDKFLDYIGDYKPSDFRFLRGNGFNLIRLGLIWDGAEPEPGHYNEEYFRSIDRIIEMAAEEDICVFLDMHQDLFGVVFEDGAPAWATVTDGCEHIRTGLWSESYLASPAVQHAFDNFWNNAAAPDGKGIRTHYVELWKYIAKRYKENPYVIGYDIMNEPFPGSAGALVAGILFEAEQAGKGLAQLSGNDEIAELIGRIAPITAEFETEILNPFYDEAAAAIREVDPQTIIMLESNYFANAAIPSVLRPACFSDGSQIPFQAYVPHGYDILVDTEAYNEGGTERVALIFDVLMQHAKEMGLPTLIGEWGCYPNASEAQKQQASFLLDRFINCYGVGNVYYDFSHIYGGQIIEVLKRQN